MTTELLVVERASFPSRAAHRLMLEIRRVLDSQERCSLALAGGSTPRPVYEALAAESAGRELWSRVDLFFGDERCVPPDDAASNYRMVREALVDRVPLGSTQVHRMQGERADRDAAARAYGDLLPVRLDLMVLGIGDDGHTASLFPGAVSLAERHRRVLAVTGSTPPRDRLTVTPPVILDAGLTIGLVTGASKAEVFARVLDGPYDPDRTPAQLARAGLWIADTAAAARVEATLR